jgi:hypothetical protein
MAAVSHVYAQFIRSACHKEVNLEADTLKLMITTASYAYNVNTDRYQSTVTNEVSGTGYSAGGAALTGVAVTDTGGTYTLDANDLTFSTVTFTSGQVLVIYDSTPGSGATNPLIWMCDLGAGQSPAGVNFTISFNASGIFTATIT